MTPEGHAQLKEELSRLKHQERPAIIKALAEAREHGDLSENAEYHAARERQSFIEGRMLELEGHSRQSFEIELPPAKLSHVE
jgi:transcription elongation factor GreA